MTSQRHVDSADPVILWFRTDLRLHDHPSVASALDSGRPIIPLYIYDDALYTRPLGAASRWWLHRSLKVLDEELRHRSSRLIIAEGASHRIIEDMVDKTGAKTVICSHSFDPVCEKNDDNLGERLKRKYVDFERHNATLLAPPGVVKTRGGTPFRVFTPFRRALSDEGFFDNHAPHRLPAGKWRAPESWPHSVSLDSLGLDDTHTASGKNWAAGFDRFTPGETGARAALDHFIEHDLAGYETGRDRADKDATSHLSAHLRFGEISPERILYEVAEAVTDKRSLSEAAAKFRSELAWRDFCYGLLDQQPKLDHVNFRAGFDDFPWRDDDKGFQAWCRGETGYELVDAGMRELWQTGYMHNRVRMVCASFLIKHLMIDWRRGEQWFWDCLVDADPANNPGNWQWVAGSGADASPFFRVFNPLTQAEKFDPAGLYRQRYLGGYKEKPIIEHAFARQRVLDAYRTSRADGKTVDDDAD